MNWRILPVQKQWYIPFMDDAVEIGIKTKILLAGVCYTVTDRFKLNLM
jgi:hypothetical protein